MAVGVHNWTASLRMRIVPSPPVASTATAIRASEKFGITSANVVRKTARPSPITAPVPATPTANRPVTAFSLGVFTRIDRFSA